MKVIVPRTTRTIRTSRWRSVTSSSAMGMKSVTSPTPASVMKRVTSMAVFGRYSWRVTYSSVEGRMLQYPPRSLSSNDANTLGESKRGQQNQSIVPFVSTNAAVCKSPISPWSAMFG